MVSELVSVHVIPRPANGMRGLTGGDVGTPGKTTSLGRTEDFVKPAGAVKRHVPESAEATAEPKVQAKPAPKAKKAPAKAAPKTSSALPTFAEVQSLNVSKLRGVARRVPGFPMTRTEINYAKRGELLPILEQYLPKE